jgi:L-fuculose-phosphate aldolase
MNRTEAAHAILEICARLYRRNMLAAADGNVSIRLNDNEILFTPSGKNKGYIGADDIATVTLDNKIIEGSPSTERLMHLAVYRNCPAAKVVVHAHPPTAIAWSIARPELKELPSNGLSELILALGAVPIVPYARPGTEEMGTVLVPFLQKHKVMILARHGALSWGEDLEESYNGMERLEHTAQILKSAVELGGLSSLPEEEIAVLRKMREKMGNRSL